MHSIWVVVCAAVTALLCFPSLTPAAALPATSSSSLSLSIPPKFPDPYAWKIPGSYTRRLIFSRWDEELPIFDDVISAFEKAEAEITAEIKMHGRGGRMEMVRTYKSGTAKLLAHYGQSDFHMNLGEAMTFLAALRLSGEVFGFWGCFVEYSDSAFRISRRGFAQLSSIDNPDQATD